MPAWANPAVAMELAVSAESKRALAGTELVRRAIAEIVAGGADEVVLEAEVTNRGALALYEGLGFLRDKRLLRCAQPRLSRSCRGRGTCCGSLALKRGWNSTASLRCCQAKAIASHLLCCVATQAGWHAGLD